MPGPLQAQGALGSLVLQAGNSFVPDSCSQCDLEAFTHPDSEGAARSSRMSHPPANFLDPLDSGQAGVPSPESGKLHRFASSDQLHRGTKPQHSFQWPPSCFWKLIQSAVIVPESHGTARSEGLWSRPRIVQMRYFSRASDLQIRCPNR